MKSIFLLLMLLFFKASFCTAQQNPEIRWENALGGPSIDKAYSIEQTADSGFIIAGGAQSNGGDVLGCHGTAYDYWIVKLDSHGKAQWAKCYGGKSSDRAVSIKQTIDKGYIVAGLSGSRSGDVTGHHRSNNGEPDDIWIVKLDSIGNIEWESCYGGDGEESPSDIELTSDGGYVFAGRAESKNGDVTENKGGQDCWIVKLNNEGAIMWQKTYGGASFDGAQSIKQLSDGGYLFAAYSYSYDGDVTGHHGKTSHSDTWVVRIDSLGNIIWQNSYGGTKSDGPTSIALANDGNFVIASSSNSKDEDVTGNHGSDDYWIIKIDSNGNLLNEVSLGGNHDDEATSVKSTDDGGYIVAGYSFSQDGDITGHHGTTGSADFWIVKLGSKLTLKGEISLGGQIEDQAHDVVETAEKDFVIAGSTKSSDVDVTGLHNSRDNNYEDFWVVRLKHSAFSDEDSSLVREIRLRQGGFNIFPTITPGTFEVNLQTSNGSTEQATIQVFNRMGQLVLSKQTAISNGMLNAVITLDADTPKGIYFIRLKTGNQQYSGKVVYQ